MPRRICVLLFTFTIMVAAAPPAVAQLLPQVTPKPAKAPATKPAQIVVETSPNAEVYLDDQYTGRASPEGRLVIGNPKPGEHNLRVSFAGKRDFQWKITVVAGKEVKIAATLAALPGSILVRTTPGAEVSLDNSSRGVADASGQLTVSEVATGVHALRIEAPGKKDFSQTVNVSSGEVTRIGAGLVDLPVVTTNPATGGKGELFSAIARTHDELVALAHKSDRDYFEFSLPRRQAQQKVGRVIVELVETDPNLNLFTVNLYIDEKRTQRRGRAVGEHVYFYAQGASSALDLVVNGLGKDSIAGYISTPKGFFSSTPNVLTIGMGQGEAEKALLPGALRENPKDGLNYVWIPQGSFEMGCPPGDHECADDEKPSHQVTISKGFWIGQTEVTVGAYKRFAAAKARQMPPAPNFNSGWANDNMPIVMVTWDDAHDFCAWAGGRLPTEAEWEYAARGGSTEERYGDVDEIAWNERNSGGQTHEVAQKRANGFGLFDVLGNVWEWVKDWYGIDYYHGSPPQDPPGPRSGRLRVLRGGSWYFDPWYVRVSDRYWYDPVMRIDNFGVRCAREVAGP